jgi:prepilin-type N-terminal cleavage/methylation domain-containing protein
MPPARRDRSLSAPSGPGASSARAPARRSLSEGGFTLIELLLVTAIIVTLAAFAVAGIFGAKQRAAVARSKAELSLIAQALEDYKRHYGDYPQTGSAAQAAAVFTATIGATQAQALLFNALTGVYGPTNFTTRINGPTLVDVSKFALEATLTANTFAVATGSPPAKPSVANSFIDPWGNRYLYYYKRATPGVGGVGAAIVASLWQAPSYVLYSAGPDGAQTPPNVNTGLYTGTTQTTGTNADNLYADKLP